MKRLFKLSGISPCRVHVLILIVFFMLTVQLRGSLAIGELVPASGEYVMALTVFLLGFSIWTSSSHQVFQISRGGRITTIALLVFSHAVGLYSYMEFYVKRGSELGTFKTISLQQDWWWSSDISPNIVYWTACAAFAGFLYFLWAAVSLPERDEQ
jgi:hypothetical protein